MQPASSASLEAQWPDLVAAVSAAIDLEATARTSEALVRRREIRSAEALLRLALAYGPGGLSLRTAAAWAGVSGLADLSDTAAMNRLRKAAGWLGEIAGALLRRAAAASTALDGPLPGRRLRIADGSMITGPGGKPKWRLLDADRAPPAWERIFGDLAVGEVAERAVSVDHSGKGGKSRGDAVFPARLIVLRLAPETAGGAAKAQHRRQNRCRSHRPLQPLTVQATGYLMLVTSLPAAVPASEVLEAYRLRWQVELAFKRLKSLLGLDRLPAKSAALARSWLLAHRILALLIEDTARTLLDFPPWADAPTLHLTLRVTQALRDALLTAVR